MPGLSRTAADRNGFEAMLPLAYWMKSRILRGHLRLVDEVDELHGGLDIAGILRDDEGVEPHQRALFRDRIGDLDAVLGLLRALLGLEDIAE
jgi:hypothetical protein